MRLFGIACADAGFGTAVGNYYNGSTNQTFIEEWDGSGWSTVSSPDTSTTESNALYGVDCVSSAFCFATGAANTVSTTAGAMSQTLVEEWQGQPQTVVPEVPWTAGLALAGGAFLMAAGTYRRRRALRPTP